MNYKQYITNLKKFKEKLYSANKIAAISIKNKSRQDNLLSWTYCHKTGTRPPNCVKPRQPTIYISLVLPLKIKALFKPIKIFTVSSHI